MSEKIPRVRLELDSRPESVMLVRGMLAGVGETLRLNGELLDDLKTAVSEACNNVILHAYDGEAGMLEVDFEIGAEQLEVSVRDHGQGIHGVAAATTDRMGVGLAVISALADQATFSSPRDGGTEVRMMFSAQTAGISLPSATSLDGDSWSDELAGDVVVRLTPTALLAGVLGRIARAAAAWARFSVDRLSDFYPLADALGVHVEATAAAERMAFAIASAERRLELTIGPFQNGAGAQLKAEPNAPPSASPVTLLADEVSTERHGDSELLHVLLEDRRRDGRGGMLT